MRTYSFDHFQADKPEPSTTNPGGAEHTPPVEQAKHGVPPSEEGQLHYGRQHAQTAELYRKHREERERTEQMRVSGGQEEQTGAEAPPAEVTERQATQRKEPLLGDKADVEDRQAFQPDEPGIDNLKSLAQQAVSSVLEAAKEAAKGRPLTGARKLASDAFSGVRRVAREVSTRTSRSNQKEQKGGTKKKGPGKKR
ncbi:hypothetical protein ACN28E_51115 [Archangium lansingense]|uniref:hypothetical protein n=1 Tax=Archangium lansingense TaxID=2995310 RepID=UPI003B7FF039